MQEKQPRKKGKGMKMDKKIEKDEMRDEYDFDYSKGVRGKYYDRLIREGSNIVVLEPDLAKLFRNSEEVNDALRSLLEVSEITRRVTSERLKVTN